MSEEHGSSYNDYSSALDRASDLRDKPFKKKYKQSKPQVPGSVLTNKCVVLPSGHVLNVRRVTIEADGVFGHARSASNARIKLRLHPGPHPGIPVPDFKVAQADGEDENYSD